MKDQSPLFVLGNPRSGTSLLRIILNAHPNIVIPPECGFLQWWYTKYKEWSIWDCNPTKVEEYVKDVLSSKKIEGYSILENDLTNYILSNEPKNYASLSALVYHFYGRKKDVKLWGDKNNYYINHIPLIKEIYPNAKFVHLIRDGRDVACSYKELSKNIETGAIYRPILSNKVVEIANEWKSNNTLIANEIRNNSHYIVKYEDIVLNFDKTIKKILDFLKLPWNDSVENYYKLNDEPSSTLKWKAKTLEPLDKESVGRFLKELTNEEIKAFESVAHSKLNYYGYV